MYLSFMLIFNKIPFLLSSDQISVILDLWAMLHIWRYQGDKVTFYELLVHGNVADILHKLVLEISGTFLNHRSAYSKLSIHCWAITGIFFIRKKNKIFYSNLTGVWFLAYGRSLLSFKVIFHVKMWQKGLESNQ